MARFSVHRMRGFHWPVVDVQADILRDLHTRLVIPLAPAERQVTEEADRLRPRIDVDGTIYLLNTPELAAVSCSDLEPAIANLQEQHHVIVDAIDFLLQGF